MKTANSHPEPAYFHTAAGSDNHAKLVSEGRWELTVDRVGRIESRHPHHPRDFFPQR